MNLQTIFQALDFNSWENPISIRFLGMISSQAEYRYRNTGIVIEDSEGFAPSSQPAGLSVIATYTTSPFKATEGTRTPNPPLTRRLLIHFELQWHKVDFGAFASLSVTKLLIFQHFNQFL